MKKLFLPVAIVAMMAVPGSALAANADLEQQGDLFSANTTSSQASFFTTNPNVVGDAIGELRYREDADKTRREIRVRAENLIIWTGAATVRDVQDTDNLAICINGAKDDTTMSSVSCGSIDDSRAIRPAAAATFAPFFTNDLALEVRGRSEDGKPDPSIVVPDLDGPSTHLVEVINGSNGLISAAGVLAGI